MKYRPSLRKRIYLTIGAVVVLSFIAIGTVTMIFFKSQNEAYHVQRLARKESAVRLSIDYFLNAEGHDKNPDSLVQKFDTKICELATINNMDINIYSLDGSLLINSNPDLFDDGLLPTELDEVLLENLKTQTTVTRELGNNQFHYLSSYNYILDQNNQPIAILNLPYFAVNDRQRLELNDFLFALAEIYGVLFLVAIVVAWLLSRYITRSLKEIGSRIRKIQINQKNEALVWNSEDEIGALVQAYNDKLSELEESAEKLALSERQSAWKEMAKQVAHEIKNPLTPLRLNVQLLERQLKPDVPDFEEKLKTFCESTLQQIETLNSIASAFSNFASLELTQVKRTNVCELISTCMDIYTNQGVKVICETDALYAKLDANQWTRVMNNVVQNALQAIPEGRDPKVEIRIKSHGKGMLLIEVSDNGTGIVSDPPEKIFEPSFTTKSSGMGLGLAMVKTIVEEHHGSIGFETNNGMGTTFYIQIPRVA